LCSMTMWDLHWRWSHGARNTKRAHTTSRGQDCVGQRSSSETTYSINFWAPSQDALNSEILSWAMWSCAPEGSVALRAMRAWFGHGDHELRGAVARHNRAAAGDV